MFSEGRGQLGPPDESQPQEQSSVNSSTRLVRRPQEDGTASSSSAMDNRSADQRLEDAIKRMASSRHISGGLMDAEAS